MRLFWHKRFAGTAIRRMLYRVLDGQRECGQVKQSIDASNTVIGEYMCQGKMPQSVRERYVKMKENPEHPANLDLLIQNFDRALSHPDSEDLERLKKSL